MSAIRERLSTQLLTGKEKLSCQLITGKERMKASHEKLKLKVKVVGSKLREEGPRGARRSAWCLLAAALFYQGWKFNAILYLILGLAFFVFLLVPFVFRFTPFIQRHIVFLPFIRMLRKVDLYAGRVLMAPFCFCTSNFVGKLFTSYLDIVCPKL